MEISWKTLLAPSYKYNILLHRLFKQKFQNQQKFHDDKHTHKHTSLSWPVPVCGIGQSGYLWRRSSQGNVLYDHIQKQFHVIYVKTLWQKLNISTPKDMNYINGNPLNNNSLLFHTSKSLFCIDFSNRNSRFNKTKKTLSTWWQTRTYTHKHTSLSWPLPVCGIDRVGTCGGAPLKETRYVVWTGTKNNSNDVIHVRRPWSLLHRLLKQKIHKTKK